MRMPRVRVPVLLRGSAFLFSVPLAASAAAALSHAQAAASSCRRTDQVAASEAETGLSVSRHGGTSHSGSRVKATAAETPATLPRHRESLSQHIEKNRVLVTRELARVKAFHSEALNKLQRAKVHYETELAKTIEDLARIINEEVSRVALELETCLVELSEETPQPASQSPLLQRLSDAGDGQELLSLSMELKLMDLPTFLKQSLSISLQYSESPPSPTKLYKFFGGANCIACFDAERETCEKPTVASQKFLHNSCWCSLPTGEVVITGGSLTGHSRNTVLRYSPKTGATEDLEPMNIARRSHASVYFEQSCYVFGGVLEEERISLCEGYDLENKKWASIPQMKERREYLGACVFRSLIVVCGGAETSSCEVFYPAEGRFQYVALPSANLADVASMLTVGDSILIFHGNFTGEVSRLYPLTSQIANEGSFCYGNSWSSCAPLLINETIYMLRADSVFKYSLPLKTSSYVLRLNKTTKRRDFE